MKLASLSSGGADRCAIVELEGRLILAVADGAGNSGALAAATVIEFLYQNLDPVEMLRRCDQALAKSGRQTTAVVAIVDQHGIRGASVGDSGAWLIEPGVELTQLSKPLIGSGKASPVPFSSGPLDGTLLLVSDGILKYAPMSRIRELAGRPDFDAIPRQLIDAVRLPSGKLQDDATVVLCRATSSSD